MQIVEMLVPMGLLLGFGFITAFAMAVRTGQFDDTETPAMRIFDDEYDLEMKTPIHPQSGSSHHKGVKE